MEDNMNTPNEPQHQHSHSPTGPIIGIIVVIAILIVGGFYYYGRVNDDTLLTPTEQSEEGGEESAPSTNTSDELDVLEEELLEDFDNIDQELEAIDKEFNEALEL